MRMKKLLMFFVLLLITIGAKAAPVEIKWPDAGPGQEDIVRIKIHYNSDNPGNQEIEIKGARGSFAEFMALVNDNNNTDAEVVAARNAFASCTNLKLKGNWNAADFNALNSSSATSLASVTTLDFSDNNFSVEKTSDISGMALSNLETVRFSDDFVVESEPEYDGDGKMANAITFTADNAIKQLSTTNNPKLKLAYALYKGGTPPNDYNKFVVHSFQADAFSNFMAENGSVASDPPTPAYRLYLDIRKAKYVGMSGELGEGDLVTNKDKNSRIFSDNDTGRPAVWDFTDATFVNCEGLVASGVTTEYSAIDDCFEENPKSAPGNVATNAFVYFGGYAGEVASIKLPTGIEELPPVCLSSLASANLENYKLVTGKTDDELRATYQDLSGNNQTMSYVPITTLVIPNNIKYIGYEAVKWGHLYTVEIGSGIQEIRGGAFKKCDQLESLEFKSGIAGECKIGESCFSDCQNMAHIELCEGIVSLGAACFEVSHYLESIRLPDTLTKIGNRAFKNCHALSSIIIPPNVDQIGMQTFHNTGLKDIYLTNPNRVPTIFSFNSAGQGSDNSTFYDSEVWAWNGIPDAGAPQAHPDFTQMTWEEAADWYYMNCNRLAALHYPPTLADVLHAEITRSYHLWSSEHDGLPAQQDLASRLGVEGATDANGNGQWTTAGWAQFLLMRESKPENVFEKQYEDVWYTMCFPFDLTDEQLASAFNETFNIVDFSGVEIQSVEGTNTKNLILHFNNVAETFYKDTSGKIYERKRDGNGNVIREKPEDNDFEYNVYLDEQNNEYHHVTVGVNGSKYKTKTFKKYVDGSPTGDVLYIDGYLAIAGHPYMIHPSTGATVLGSPANCRFRGITYKPVDNPATETTETNYDWLYEQEARTVDLGVAKTTDNFNQAAYPTYAGQTYTFKGNWRDYSADAPAEPIKAAYPTEPTKAPYPEEPTKAAYPAEPTMEPEPQQPTTPEITTVPTDPRLNPVDNPADNTTTYPEKFQTFYNTVRDNTTSKWGELMGVTVTEYSHVAELHDWTGTNKYYTGWDCKAFNVYLGVGNDVAIDPDVFKDAFDELKTKCPLYKTALDAYNAYEADVDQYVNVDYPAYIASHTEWETYRTAHSNWEATAQSNYDAAHTQWEQDCQDIDNAYTAACTQWEQDCQDIDDAYNTAHGKWEQNCQTIDNAYNTAHAQWEASLANYPVQIPKYAYFLARANGVKYPKYYREMADEGPGRTGGKWSKYSAIIIPNQEAIDGIEKGIETTTSGGNVKGLDMVFNEDFMGEFDPTEIKDIIANAEEKNQKVEYMNIVYSINGEIISRDARSLNNLPKGMYIINGKKYMVK